MVTVSADGQIRLESNTRKVVDAILTSGRVEQQTYRSCMGLLKLV